MSGTKHWTERTVRVGTKTAARAAFVVLAAWAGSAAAANDYPTLERVEYVLGCARDLDASNEAIYKCVCVIDRIAEQLPYEQYVEYTTAANAFSIGGERGETMRAYGAGKEMAGKYRALQAQARKACFINK